MTEYILGTLSTLLAIWIGYSIGKGSSIIPKETTEQVKRLIRALPIDRGLGAVERPTAHQVEQFNNPVLKEEEEAMSDTFKEIVK
jgi:hypothetical protein